MAVGADALGVVVVKNFSHPGGGVAVGAEVLGHGDGVGDVVTEQPTELSHAILFGIEAGHEAGPGLSTHREIGEGVAEGQAVAGELIEVRSLNQRVAVGAEVAVQIVGHDEEHVQRRFGGGLGGSCHRNRGQTGTNPNEAE